MSVSWLCNGTPFLDSCLENPLDGGAWWAAVHGVSKSQTLLSDFTFTFHFYALEKEMATHSSSLAWRIPGTGEPGGLPSMGLHRVRHDWSDLASWLWSVSVQSFNCVWLFVTPWTAAHQASLSITNWSLLRLLSILGLIPGLGRSPVEVNGCRLQYSGLENSMDCIVHGVTESDMTEQLSVSLSKLVLMVLNLILPQWCVTVVPT